MWFGVSQRERASEHLSSKPQAPNSSEAPSCKLENNRQVGRGCLNVGVSLRLGGCGLGFLNGRGWFHFAKTDSAPSDSARLRPVRAGQLNTAASQSDTAAQNGSRAESRQCAARCRGWPKVGGLRAEAWERGASERGASERWFDAPTL